MNMMDKLEKAMALLQEVDDEMDEDNDAWQDLQDALTSVAHTMDILYRVENGLD